MTRFVLGLAALAATVISPLAAQEKHVSSIRRLDGTVISGAEAETFAKATLDRYHVAGAQISVLHHGKRVWMQSFGSRNVDSRLPMQNDSGMWAASITKSVFGTFVLQMVERGELDLDTPIEKLLPKALPEYEKYRDLASDPRWKKITPRHLLSHNAGFANFAALEPDGKLRIHFDPGTRFAYSGEGINLLQFVIEEKTGRTLTELEDERLFQPLGMKNTSLVWQDRFAEKIASGHDADGKVIGFSKRQRPRAAGSMTITIEDLTTFTEALLANQVITAKSRKELFKPSILIDSKYQFPTLLEAKSGEGPKVGLAYGAGWGLLTKTPYGPAFFKEGHGDGAQNYMICFEKSGTCMIMLTNSDNGEFAFRPLLEKVIGDTVTPWEWEGYTPERILEGRKHN